MNDCMNAEVRDALPDLMHGRLSDLDKATMTAHVESCADCREELRLLEEIRASAPPAPRIDVSRVVAALPAAMPSSIDHLVDRGAAARARTATMWKTMAAAALLITGTLTFATARRQTIAIAPSASSVAQANPEVSTQPARTDVAAGATQVAVATAAPVVAASARPVASSRAELSLTGGVQDLGEEELQALLKDLENVQGLPAAEPEAMTISVDDNEGLQ
ncbi:MAG TPA: zf-HC2 domain-containing protein [Gemmatimonadaceae bacterium]|nr:zf-HC2 domain-containing protein [Gemmatimonadaceae bacterium]